MQCHHQDRIYTVPLYHQDHSTIAKLQPGSSAPLPHHAQDPVHQCHTTTRIQCKATIRIQYTSATITKIQLRNQYYATTKIHSTSATTPPESSAPMPSHHQLDPVHKCQPRSSALVPRYHQDPVLRHNEDPVH